MTVPESTDARSGPPLGWAHVDRLLSFVDEAVVCIDETGTVIYVNSAITRLTGYDPSAVVGRSIAEFVHPDDLEGLLAILERWEGRQGSGGISAPRVRSAEGEWVTVTVDGITGADLGPLGAAVATLRATDETSSVEQELRSRLSHESRLVRIASSFVHLPNEQFEDGVQAALAELATMGAVDRVGLVLFDLETERLTLAYEWVAPGVPPTREAGRWYPMVDTPFLRQLRDHREINMPSIDQLPEDWEVERAWWEARGVRSSLTVPLADQGRVIGLIGFEGVNREWTFQASHVLSLRTAAGILGQALGKRAAEERLAFNSRHDALTGLPNRWAFVELLERAVHRLHAPRTVNEASSGGVAVLLFDLDRFKVVNDSLGHRLGDQLVVEVARRLDRARPEGTTLARMGGDELVVMAEHLAGPDEALSLAAELRRVLRRSMTVEGHEVSSTTSVGIAFAHDPSESADDLLRHADSALYAAKELGRDRIEIFDETLRAKVRRRLQDEIELRQALDQGQLLVYYQPEVEVPSGEVLAVEALVRWQHPDRGLLAAAEFIALAEETGLIIDIGLWVLSEACRQHVRWREAWPERSLLLRVNLSALQLGEADLLPKVMGIINETGIEPGSLCLEITETVVMADAERSLEVLQKLRGLGVELAIDDFGTGYSSLSYLKRLPVDVLKVDRSFVDGLGTDPDDTAIVQAIMVLAGSLGLTVTAEGVETDIQLGELLRLGCRRVQGFYYAPPQPGEVVASWLESGLALGHAS